MNRKELVSALADKAGVSQTDADKVLDAFQGIVFEVVAVEGESLTLPGFLKFEQSARSARSGRNPSTGEPIEIPASKTAKVTAGSKLKAAAAGK